MLSAVVKLIVACVGTIMQDKDLKTWFLVCLDFLESKFYILARGEVSISHSALQTLL